MFAAFVVFRKAKLSERALELLALPDDGVPRLLLDIGNLLLYMAAIMLLELYYLLQIVNCVEILKLRKVWMNESLN